MFNTVLTEFGGLYLNEQIVHNTIFRDKKISKPKTSHIKRDTNNRVIVKRVDKIED